MKESMCVFKLAAQLDALLLFFQFYTSQILDIKLSVLCDIRW